MATKGNLNETVKPKKKSFIKGCATVLLVIFAILAIAAAIGWSFLSKEHKEAKNLPIKNVKFDQVKDGTYHGVYDGGMYQWRINECDVTVASGRVTDIQLTKSIDLSAENAGAEELYARVIQAQSLQVDTISSATLTGKAYLKAVENALELAQ